MTDRELMQQALNYLDAPSSKVWAAGTQYKIIQALRARLSQCDRCGEVNPAEIHTCTPRAFTNVDDLIADLEKPEPVAWMYDWYDETEDIDGVPIGGIVHDWISKDYDEAHSPTMGCHNIRPLYTTPPQRECEICGKVAKP